MEYLGAKENSQRTRVFLVAWRHYNNRFLGQNRNKRIARDTFRKNQHASSNLK